MRGAGAMPWGLFWRWAGPDFKFASFKASSCFPQDGMALMSTLSHITLYNVGLIGALPLYRGKKKVQFLRQSISFEVIITQLQPLPQALHHSAWFSKEHAQYQPE